MAGVPRRQFDDNGNCINPEPPESRQEQLLRQIAMQRTAIRGIDDMPGHLKEQGGQWLQQRRAQYEQRLADLQQQLQQGVS